MPPQEGDQEGARPEEGGQGSREGNQENRSNDREEGRPGNGEGEQRREDAQGINHLLIDQAQRELDELVAKAQRNERLTGDELKRVGDLQEMIGRLRSVQGQVDVRGRIQGLETMSAAELEEVLRRERLTDEEKQFVSLLRDRKSQEEYYATINPIRYAQMQPHWDYGQQKEWLHHQIKLLLESRKLPDAPENKIPYQVLEQSKAILDKMPELREEYDALTPFYYHFAILTSSRDLDQIVQHAASLKAEDMKRILNLPLVSDAVRLWEKNGSYKEFLGTANTPKDINGNLLESVITLQGPALELRKLSMAGDMTKLKLAFEIARKQAKDHGVAGWDEPGFKPSPDAIKIALDEVNRKLNLNFLDKYRHESPPGHASTQEKAKYHWDLKDAEEQIAIQRAAMMEKIDSFIRAEKLNDILPDSFFTRDGENKEQAINKGKDFNSERRTKAETLFEEAQLGLYSGEAVWRTFERAAFHDGENPHEVTPEGGGENPLRRLLNVRKYTQELLKDGKIKHAQPQIVEHMVNPLRDFLSDGGDSFWKAQPQNVQDWFMKMVKAPDKIDQYGRFTDMSECPFQDIDFRLYQEIPDRSPLTPHYSNFFELAEELRKQEELKPGALLETPTLENYINFVKLYRNLRSEDVFENKQARDKAETAYKEGKGRKPLTSREEAAKELFKGLVDYWRENGIMADESIINAILMISDPSRESFITPKNRDELIRYVYGNIWGRWPMWEIRQVWAKIDWGAGFLNGIKALFKEVFKQGK